MSEGKRWGAEIFASKRERELASEIERLQGEVVDLRRERDDEKALAEGLSKRVAMLQKVSEGGE